MPTPAPKSAEPITKIMKETSREPAFITVTYGLKILKSFGASPETQAASALSQLASETPIRNKYSSSHRASYEQEQTPTTICAAIVASPSDLYERPRYLKRQ